MAKKQRRDSIQEHMIEHLDERKKRLEREARQGTVIRTYVTIPVTELRLGMHIATKVNENNGRVTAQQEVRELVPQARGCRNVHVNGKDCYDRCASIRIVKSYTVQEGDFMLPDGSYGSEKELLAAFGVNKES